MKFESRSTIYEVIAQRFPDHPGTILFAFGLRGAPMTADFVADDEEPWDFHGFEEHWARRSLSEADLWVGFLLLRGVLGYPVEFEDLPVPDQRQARTYLLGDRPHLVGAVESWPKGWQAQIAALRAAVMGSA